MVISNSANKQYGILNVTNLDVYILHITYVFHDVLKTYKAKTNFLANRSRNSVSIGMSSSSATIPPPVGMHVNDVAEWFSVWGS